MNIKTKLTLYISLLVAMIVLLVVLSVVNLQLLTETDPNSPAAHSGLARALVWILAIGSVCILTGIVILVRVPKSINEPIRKLADALQQIAERNYDAQLQLTDSDELRHVSRNFNTMAQRLSEYNHSTLASLMASKQYMETVINAISEPIIGLDSRRTILFINNEALNVLNLKRDAVVNHSAEEIAISNDLLRRLLRGMIDSGSSVASAERKEPLKIYADHKESYFQVKYMPTAMPDGASAQPAEPGLVIMLRNITEFKELDTAKTTFISTISHELKTPISAILMSLQLLADKRIGELNAEQEELSNSIRENSERLLSISGELLNMTQVESGKLQLKPKITKPIELIEYAIKANRVQAEKFGIQLEVEYPASKIGKLFVDSEKIAWVLTNLLSNAIRYSPENSRVIIGARAADDKHISLYVTDFGRGIDPRYHSSIFDHYFRVPGTKVQGSGLGLSISRDFVEAHNGTLAVESAVGMGSTFTMTLPC